QGLTALLNDAETRVVVLVSKPPHPEVAARVLDVARSGDKPVVVIFLGRQAPPDADGKASSLTFARTLEEAAQFAVALAGGGVPASQSTGANEVAAPKMQPGQKYVRGLFSGGTFCSEALGILTEALGPVYSNVSKSPELGLPNPHRSVKHTCIDI